MPAEAWRPVPGWPGYEASDRGRVRSVDRVLPDGRTAGGKLLKTARDKDGYRRVSLWDGPLSKRYHVASLVLAAFEGPRPYGQEALHGNGRRWDNRLANLRWGTRPENRADRERHRRERAGTEVTGVKEGERSEIDVAAPCPLRVTSGNKEVPGQKAAETGARC